MKSSARTSEFPSVRMFQEKRMNDQDMKLSIKKFFDDIDQKGDKSSKDLLKHKFNEIVIDTDQKYQKKNLAYIKKLDDSTKAMKKHKV